MINIVIQNESGEVVFEKPEKEFIRAEFLKRRRVNTGIIVCMQLELHLKGERQLEEVANLENVTMKIEDSDSGDFAGIENGYLDEYRVRSSNDDKLVEVLSVAGDKI